MANKKRKSKKKDGSIPSEMEQHTLRSMIEDIGINLNEKETGWLMDAILPNRTKANSVPVPH